MEQKILDELQEDLEFYNEECIEEQLKNDEIDAREEGFMMGYLS